MKENTSENQRHPHRKKSLALAGLALAGLFLLSSCHCYPGYGGHGGHGGHGGYGHSYGPSYGHQPSGYRPYCPAY